jgi:glycosyltransferase involved in cell wall biosynthesis
MVQKMALEAKKLFLVVNVDWFFLSHRLPIALAAKQAGYQVTIVTGDTGKLDQIATYGLGVVRFPFKRNKSSIFNELKALVFLAKLYRQQKPDLVHLVGFKLILFGTIARLLSGQRIKIVNALSGAGTLFTNDQALPLSVSVLIKLFNFSSQKKDHYIFQNSDDLTLFKTIAPKVDIYTIIKGSGVDLQKFYQTVLPESLPKQVIFVGRVLKEKGIFELIQAANLLKDQLMGKAKFVFIGDIDQDNPSSLSVDQMENLMDGDYTQWHGHQTNVFEYIQNSYLVVLPSYREGLPKTLIEACAVGRPIVTTDTVGCKEVVTEGQNGYLVPVKDINLLAQRIKFLIENPDIAQKMAQNSRTRAELEFDLAIVTQKTLGIYNKLLTV